MNRGKRGENRLWKRVTPSVTEFAWLPPNLAESFCKNALYREEVRTYCAFDTPHLGLDTKNFVADVFVENILYLGDTRSADDLSVFTKMAPERLCLGCGLRVDEPLCAHLHRRKEETLLRCSETSHLCPARSKCTDTECGGNCIENCFEASDHQQGWALRGCGYLDVSITA